MHFISNFTRLAVVEVYNTMLSLQLDPRDLHEGNGLPQDPVNGVVGSVGFAGKISGTLYMKYSNSLACAVTERLIGVKPSSTEDAEVNDVIGEITNMVSGTMKGQASKMGYHGWLSTPVILKGEDIYVDGKGAPISSFSRFHVPIINDALDVWVFAKLDEGQ